jgi:hypothetical protein
LKKSTAADLEIGWHARRLRLRFEYALRRRDSLKGF